MKAENVLLDRKKTLKITDFGMARGELQDEDTNDTLEYMPLEVLQGKPYDPKPKAQRLAMGDLLLRHVWTIPIARVY